MADEIQSLPAFIHAMAPFVHQYGYLAVGLIVFVEGFGVPTPGQTSIVVAAFLAGTGQLSIYLVMLVAAVAAIAGDNIGYAIGRFGGYPLVDKYGKYVFLTRSRMDKVEKFFKHKGGWIIIVARFVDVLRQLNGLIAGVSEMRWRNFLSFNVIGGVLWVITWSMVGYFGGDYIDDIYRYGAFAAVALAVLFVLYIIYRIIKARRERAKAGQKLV